MYVHLIADPDLECLMPDSTIVRYHPCAAGAPGKKDVNLLKHCQR